MEGARFTERGNLQMRDFLLWFVAFVDDSLGLRVQSLIKFKVQSPKFKVQSSKFKVGRSI